MIKKIPRKAICKYKTYITRDGNKTEIFSVSEPTDSRPAAVDGVIIRRDGAKESHHWNKDGLSFEGIDELDLLEAGLKHERTCLLALHEDGYMTVVSSYADALEWDEKLVSIKKITVSFKSGEFE